MPVAILRRFSAILGAVGLTLLAAAGLRLAAGGAPAPGAPSTPLESGVETPPPEAPDSLIGMAAADTVRAFAGPSPDADVVAEFSRINDQGARQAFLLLSEERAPNGTLPEETEWVEALLPVRPNGTTGYLRVDDLNVVGTDYRILVDREQFRLTLYEGDEVVMETDVGIGTGETPTPVGTFYLTSLLQPPTNNTIYGTYAYGLSGFSEQLTDWAGGGIIGLHGTNDRSSVGGRVSHGCIRMRNEDIERLVPILPLGTPIEIV